MQSLVGVTSAKVSIVRDEFTEDVRRQVALRVSYLCSNPDCRASTTGPKTDEPRSQCVGTASHITAAAPGGPRYDPALSSPERKHYRNAIWLCNICGRIIDNDYSHYSVDLLQEWKRQAEKAANDALGKPRPPIASSSDKYPATVEAAQNLSKMAVSLWNELYSFIANNFDITPNDEWRQLRRGISDFADLISTYEWLFSTIVIDVAREVCDFYLETLFEVSKSNAHRSYDNKMTTAGAEIRRIASAEFVQRGPILKTKLAVALRVDK